MIYYGNEFWNKSTDNKEKTVVALKAQNLQKVMERLDNAGMNYYAFVREDNAKIAINTTDTERFKELIGKSADKLTFDISAKTYTPPKNNIIGNTDYRYISNKAYFSGDTDILLKMAELMQRQGIKFSGKIYSQKKTTLTVNKSDIEHLAELRNEVQNIRSSVLTFEISDKQKVDDIHFEVASKRDVSFDKSVKRTKSGNEIIGNIAYSGIKNKDWYSPNMSVERYREIQPYLDKETNYSGIIKENGRIVFTVERNKMPLFLSSLFSAEQQADLLTRIISSTSSQEQKSYTEDTDEIIPIADMDFTEQLNNLTAIALDRNSDFMTMLKNNFEQSELALYSFADNYIDKIVTDLVMPENEAFMLYYFSEEQHEKIVGDIFQKGYSETAQLIKVEQFAKENGIPYSDNGDVNIDGEPNIYTYDGSMSLEDFDKWQLLNRLAVITESEDNTPYKLIDAFENAAMSDWDNNLQKQRRIKKALYSIIGDMEKTEKVYKEIAQNRAITAKLDNNVSDYSELLGIDKLNRNGNVVYWSYFNEDGNEGNGQIVELTVTDTDIQEAFKAMEAVGGRTQSGYQAFIDYIETNAAQTITDSGTLDFEGEKDIFLDGEYDLSLQANDRFEHNQIIADFLIETMYLEKAKNIINDFCVSEYSSEADFSDLGKIGIAYTTTENEEHEIQVDVDLNSYAVRYQLDGKNYKEEKYHNIEDMIENGLTGLDFNDLISVPDSIIKNFTAKEEHIDLISDASKSALEAPYTDGEQLSLFADIEGLKEEQPVDASTEHIETNNTEKIEIEGKADYKVGDHVELNFGNRHYSGTLTYVGDVDVTVKPDEGYSWEVQTINKEVFEQSLRKDHQNSNLFKENFHITDDELGEGGAKTKFKANIAAIKTLKTIEAEERHSTTDEQEIMSRYVGWGGLANAFDSTKEDWKSEYEELKELLTEQEYISARASTLDAFYTAPVIIDSIYEALESFGFNGGNVLEPALGVGNFIGRMPKEMAKHSEIHGTEIDSISGRIAQKLYPNADIKVEGFEKNEYQKGSFDVAVGNVPFGNLGFTDKKHGTSQLHDYFFAETLDKVKEGGVVAFVTSTGTLDKKDESVRKLLAEKADLIGAVRLPSGAFKANAGTDVTSDIIFLQKRSEPPVELPNWVHIGESENGLSINEYFAQNPDMILGELTEDNNPFGNGTKVVAHDGADLRDELSVAVGKLHAEISDNRAADVYKKREKGEIEPPAELRSYSLFEQNGNIYLKTIDRAYQLKYDKSNTAHRRAEAYIMLRDTTRELIEAQEQNKPEHIIIELQQKLNEQYDSFYKKYGLLHSKVNQRQLNEDISYNLVLTLEKEFDNDKLIAKSDIFTKRTIKPAMAITHTDTSIEALTLSISERAKVDFGYMEYLTDMSKEEIINDLKGEIYEVPNSGGEYQTASEYLSGDIREKLNVAKKAALIDNRFEVNVKALETAMPEPLKAADIDIKIGARWFDPKLYEQFMYETFGTPASLKSDYKGSFWEKPKTIAVEYSETVNVFSIKNKRADFSVAATNTYGTDKINAYEITEALLNLREPKVNKTVLDETGKAKRVLDADATKLAQRKAEKIKSAFKDWIFKDPERREHLVNRYNEQFNCIHPREYNGSSLRFPNMNPDIQLHEHQKNAIAHALFGGNTLFAHSVGAGKTYEMIASAMESKRLGLCTKTLMCVPNHLTEQIGTDFHKLYPGANILVASEKDFEKKNRQQLFSKIATGNFDAVIIGHSQLKKIPMSIERQENILHSQINDILHGIEELKANEGSKFNIKQMERTRKSLEKELNDLKAAKQDDVITFEQMGIDKLILDEAHEFKNLFTATKLTNVSGISTSRSQKATDLFMKCQYLDEKTGGKGIIMATGTPLSNSVTELHTMMRYLEYDFLKNKNLQHFDNWITIFGERKTDWELAPAGNKFKQKTRISNYTGMPELMSMYKQIADVRTADSLNLDVPTCELKIVQAEATEFQQTLIKELSDRADDVQGGSVDPSVDNMLRITSDGRKLGLDPRLIDPSFEDNPNTKLNKCVDNVFKIHQGTAVDRLTQVIFCDLGVPKKISSADTRTDDEKSVSELNSLEEECDFCIYDDIKKKLVERGVPEHEIAYIHDAKNEKQKTELFNKVKKGEVRILIGSTSKMGTGTNIQDRLIALHDLDIPWRPADMEQRKGRIERQGNMNDTVKIFRYVTKGTFDAYSYQTLEHKQKFISQIMTSKTPVRKCEDVDQQALNYSEIKALCTGDERIKEKMTLENEVKELRLAKAEHTNTIYEMEDKIRSAPARLERLQEQLSNLEADYEHLSKLPIDEETQKPVFKITFGKQTYIDRTEAAKAFEKAAINAVSGRLDENVTIGEFQGFPLMVRMDSTTKKFTATMKGKMAYTCDLGVSFPNNLKRLEMIYTVEQRISDVKSGINRLKIDVAEAEKLAAQTFAQENELKEKAERLEVLTDDLNKAAQEAKINRKDNKRTNYFDTAKLKKEIAKARNTPSKNVQKNRKRGKEAI